MNTDNFTPAADPAALTSRCSAGLSAASDLVESMTTDLSLAKKTALGNLVGAGGRVGVELTVDGKGSSRVCLVAIDREGGHHTLMSIVTLGQDIGVSH